MFVFAKSIRAPPTPLQRKRKFPFENENIFRSISRFTHHVQFIVCISLTARCQVSLQWWWCADRIYIALYKEWQVDAMTNWKSGVKHELREALFSPILTEISHFRCMDNRSDTENVITQKSLQIYFFTQIWDKRYAKIVDTIAKK